MLGSPQCRTFSLVLGPAALAATQPELVPALRTLRRPRRTKLGPIYTGSLDGSAVLVAHAESEPRGPHARRALVAWGECPSGGLIIQRFRQAATARSQATRARRALGIAPGGTYDLDFFFAERHTSESSFRIEATIGCFHPPG